MNANAEGAIVRHGGTAMVGRYLHYQDVRPVATGMDHQLKNLRCLLGEAHLDASPCCIAATSTRT